MTITERVIDVVQCLLYCSIVVPMSAYLWARQRVTGKCPCGLRPGARTSSATVRGRRRDRGDQKDVS